MKTLAIMRALSGHFAPPPSNICSIEPDDKGSGGGATFTQADMDRVAATVRRETADKFKDYEDIKAKAGKVDTLSTELQAIKDQLELKDADAVKKAEILAQRAREQSDREMATIKTENEALKQQTAAQAVAHKQFKVALALTDALAKSGVLQAASKHAQAVMLSEAEIDLADDGSVKGVKYNGVPQKDLVAASAAFLSANPHFKAAPGGGGGGLPPNSGAPTTDQLASMSAEDAISAGLKAPPKGAGNGQDWDANQ